jgi:hypothetical protein
VKQILTALFLLISQYAIAQPKSVEVRRLESYFFAGDNKELKSGVNYIVVTDRKQFEKLFSSLQRADTPDFSKELMLVMVMPSSRKESRLYFKSVSVKAGNFIEVNCTFDMNVQPLTYYTNPIAVCVIPRYPSIQKVNFYEEKHGKYNEQVKFRPLATLDVK